MVLPNSTSDPESLPHLLLPQLGVNSSTKPSAPRGNTVNRVCRPADALKSDASANPPEPLKHPSSDDRWGNFSLYLPNSLLIILLPLFVRDHGWKFYAIQFSSVQLLSHVQLFAIPWTAACQASLSITSSWSLLKLVPIESVMPLDSWYIIPESRVCCLPDVET